MINTGKKFQIRIKQTCLEPIPNKIYWAKLRQYNRKLNLLLLMENYKPVFSSFRESATVQYPGLQSFPKKKARVPEGSDHRRFASQLNPNINIFDPIFTQKYDTDDTLSKKKQLRRQSLKRIVSGLRVRSISTFGNLQQVSSSIPDCYPPITKNSLLFLEGGGSYVNSNQQKHKFTCTKLQKTEGITQIQTLDWSKKNRKKIRRSTQQAQYEKNSNQQSTVDFTREQNCRKLKSKVIQFKRSLSKQLKTSRQSKAFKLIQKDSIAQDDFFKALKKSDFQIGKKLGSGNFSTAYLVKHKKTGFICAMKIMSKQKIRQEQYEGQITREITIQSCMKHQNIVQLYGFFEDQENVYLLMEFCIDGHLFSQIHEPTTSSIVKGISHGLQYMHHEAIIHRDLKPENIFLTFGVPKVGDFGWAVYQGKDGLMRKTMSGSPLYYSPQIVQKEDYDEKVDIWGIGAITFQCLIGMAPFKVYSFMNLNRIVNDSLNFPSYVEVSKESVDFIERCLKKKAEQRWSVQELLKHAFFKFCAK